MRAFHAPAQIEALEARIAALEQQIAAFLPEADTAAEHKPDWLRGTCPFCGRCVESRTAYREGKGYLVFWVCVGAEETPPACAYRKIL